MISNVEATQKRMIRARGQKSTAWGAVAVLGAVGWSIAVPTLAGVAAGVWIDNRWPGNFSWTMMLLVGGLLLGCVNAWTHISGGPK
jgi:ATP synthase protein I